MSDEINDNGVVEGLSEPDSVALDALINAEMDLAKVAPELQERAQQIVSILGLLNVDDVPHSEALIDVTLARIGRTRVNQESQLSQIDESALQAWVLAGYDAHRVPGALRERARTLESLREQVTQVPLDVSAEDLVQRTLSQVQGAENDRAQRMNFENHPLRRSLGVRVADVVSVAAVLLIGAAVMWPLLTTLRNQSQRASCFQNMNTAGMGFSTYASDFRDQLPVAGTELSGPWWNTGTRNQSNSANLYQMIRTGYARGADLACSGNPTAVEQPDPEAVDWESRRNVSYSYQIMYGKALPTWSEDNRRVVIADRSPVVDVWVQGKPFFPNTNSHNHGERGQHVLLTDGSAQWLSSPETADGDNIWLPGYIEQVIHRLTGRDRNQPYDPLTGTETSESPQDVFLGP